MELQSDKQQDDNKAYFNRRKFQKEKTGIAAKINEVEESLSET